MYIVFYSMIFSLQSTRILLAMSFKAEKRMAEEKEGGGKGIGGTDVTCLLIHASGGWLVGNRWR